MCKENSRIKKSAAAGLRRAFSAFLMLLLLSAPIAAQESIAVAKESLPEGIVLQLQGAEISGAGNFLAVADSGGHSMAPRQISLDGTQLWMKRSDEAVEIPNTVHWFDDEESGLLTIDISGIRDRLTSQSQLEIVVVPFIPDESALLISLYRADERPAAGVEALQKIKDVNVEIN